MAARRRLSLALAGMLAATSGAGVVVVRADDTAPTLGQLSIQVMSEGEHGAARAPGSVELLLTCTSPVTFTHRIHTYADGHLDASVPIGSCTLESVSGVLVGATWYRWRFDIEVHPGPNPVELTGDNALADDSAVPPAGRRSEPPATPTLEDVQPVAPAADDSLPEALVRVAAEYPEDARKLRIQGKVVLQAVVGVDGRVSRITLLTSSNPLLDAAAIEAVSQYRYRPALRNGTPIPVYYAIRTDFQLR